MLPTSFQHDPNLQELWFVFPKSPYFSIEALWSEIRGGWTRSRIIAAIVWGAIVWALTWETDGRLKIWQVEVAEDQRGKGIWSQLILEAEKANK